MSIAPNAGRLPDPHTLTHLPRLVARYYSDRPDPSDPAQQADAQRAFQDAKLLAQGRLRDPQVLGGAADMALLVQSDEVPQLAKVHGLVLGYR